MRGMDAHFEQFFGHAIDQWGSAEEKAHRSLAVLWLINEATHKGEMAIACCGHRQVMNCELSRLQDKKATLLSAKNDIQELLDGEDYEETIPQWPEDVLASIRAVEQGAIKDRVVHLPSELCSEQTDTARCFVLFRRGPQEVVALGKKTTTTLAFIEVEYGGHPTP